MYRNRIKRLLDILLSACGILCLSWLLLLLAVAIKLDSPVYTFFPVDKVSFDSHQQAGNSKSATSNRNYILVLLWINIIKMYTFAGQSGSLFRTFPHIVEMRLLNIVE